MADVTIAGHKFKPWMVGAVAVGGVLVIYWAYKARSGASATSTTPADTSADTSIDPSTGVPYADESGSGLAYGYSYPSSGTSTVQGSNYPDNAAWSQAAESGLTSLGWSATDVATALGDYLAQLPLTSAQAAIVRAALAEFGPPPVGTYSVLTAPSVPSTASKPGEVSGLSITPYAGFADVGWSAVSGASSYELSVVGAGGKGTGTSHVDQTVSGTHAEHVALAPGRYQARVRARNSAGDGAWSAMHVFSIPTAAKVVSK
jgi:hypothetical protein